MMKHFSYLHIILISLVILLAACQPASQMAAAGDHLKVLAVETFLTDIAQNIAGERLQVDALMPGGLDPHAFEPSPQDIAKIAECQVLIVNGGGLEEWLEETLANAGNDPLVIVASQGLEFRHADEHVSSEGEHGHDEDPHFWLNPLLVVQYAKNIQQGLVQADPAGEKVYTQNWESYTQQLNDLDLWIQQQVAQIPPEQRLLVTNHESLGYFADQYGFQVIGTVLPGVTTGLSPSARQMAALIEVIEEYQVKAIFLEIGNNSQLADQIAQETGITVVKEIYTHTVTEAGGDASTYIDMMKYNTTVIVQALKP